MTADGRGSSLAAALAYRARGWQVVPVPHGEKAPDRKGWQDLRLSEAELPRYFAGDANIGLLLGEPSGGLLDVDLDAREAVVIAPAFLPMTDLVSGRDGNPRSHFWYVANPLPKTTRFRDPTTGDGQKGMLLEIRSTGGQTLAPPSLHPDGDLIRWEASGDPTPVAGGDLTKAAGQVAAAALLARHWPSGSRQDAALALSGALLLAGWHLVEVDRLLAAVAQAAGDDETGKRVTAGEYTKRRLDAGEPVTGLPTLSELVGEKVTHRVAEWLRLRGATDPAEAAPEMRDVDGAALLEEVVAFVRRYIVLDPQAVDGIALWVLHTHAIEAADTTPYLLMTSPEKRSGKTRLLEALEMVVCRPWLTGYVSAAVLPRKIQKSKPTLLLDEADAAFRRHKELTEALRGILDNGYRRGKPVTICVQVGKEWEPKEFSVFGPKAIAAIRGLPDTVEDRSIRIPLRRRTRGEPVAKFRWAKVSKEAQPIKEQLEAWAASHIDDLRSAEPSVPDALDDRAADCWEPLLAIADAAGGVWPDRARKAAVTLSTGEGREDESIGIVLLADIRRIFEEQGIDRIFSESLVATLNSLEASPWGDYKDGALNTRRLARLLKPYGVKPKGIRIGDRTANGYSVEVLADAWTRYVPAPEPPPESPQQGQQGQHNLDSESEKPGSSVDDTGGLGGQRELSTLNTEADVEGGGQSVEVDAAASRGSAKADSVSGVDHVDHVDLISGEAGGQHGCDHSTAGEVAELWRRAQAQAAEVAVCECCKGPTAHGRVRCLRCPEPEETGTATADIFEVPASASAEGTRS